jgi:hypothetical protein
MLIGFGQLLSADKDPVPPQVMTSPLFERIATCESGGDLHAKNKYSSASGEFQFLWGTWNHYGREYWGDSFYEKNIWSKDNRELAWYVFSKYGTRDWNASKKCWSSGVDT